MKKKKNTMDFLITKIWQILKHFTRALSFKVQTSYISENCDIVYIFFWFNRLFQKEDLLKLKNK